VLNVHAPTEDKIDDIKDRFYEELKQVFDKFPKYHTKMLLGILRFPLPIFIPPNSPSSQSPGAGTIGQKWAMCRVDPVRTPFPIMRIKKSALENIQVYVEIPVFTKSNRTEFHEI
jgi:hypothetical protein